MALIGNVGWRLEKGKIDWILRDKEGKYLCTIKISHPGAREVVASSVKKTTRLLEGKGQLPNDKQTEKKQ